MKVGKKKIFLGLGIAMAGLTLASCGEEKTSNINEFDHVISNNIIYELDSDSLEYGVYQIDSDYEGDVLKIESSFNGLPVTYIDGEYFDLNNDFSGVELPSTLKKIGAAAFVNFRNLTDITIPDSVEEIESAAFRGCSSLKNVKLNSGIKSIGSECFDSCTNLNYAIYNNGYYLGNSENPYLALIEAQDKAGFTIHEDTEIIADEACMDCTNITELTIPDSVKYIGADAFSGCNQMTNVNMSNNVISIGRGAFNRCEQLKKIELPSTIKSFGICEFNFCPNLKFNLDENENKYLGNSENPYLYLYDYNKSYIHEDTKIIGQYAFGYSDITGINIPYGVEIIESDAFIDCENLASIVIPDSVKTVGRMAFAKCISLKSVTLPKNLTEISSGLFTDCESLTDVNIPDSVTKIGSYAFEDCHKLRSIELPANVKTIGEAAFKDCILMESLEANDGLEYIAKLAFEGCITLEVFAVPESVQYINERAFKGCTRMTNIGFSASIKKLGDYLFEYCDRLYSIYCYDTLKEWNNVLVSEYTYQNSIVAKVNFDNNVSKKLDTNEFDDTLANRDNYFFYYIRNDSMEGDASLYYNFPYLSAKIKSIRKNGDTTVSRVTDHILEDLAIGDVIVYYDEDTSELLLSRIVEISSQREIVVEGDKYATDYKYTPITNTMSTEEAMEATASNYKLIEAGIVSIVDYSRVQGVVQA
ncbi:MAG: leucine-rich repeat domain-containing protein [Acholeplasmatales bacterium]|nr:leucine-rich repeat domain-containing protein [Acholeplasmatales bacterium]